VTTKHDKLDRVTPRNHLVLSYKTAKKGEEIMKIFRLVSMMIMASMMLSGCLLYDYGIGHRTIHYRGIHNEAVGQGEGQYQAKRKGNWEAEYIEGEYKTKKRGKWEEEYVEGKGENGEDWDTDESEKTNEEEWCDPIYTLSPPGDYAGDACTRLCYLRQEKCKDEIRLRKDSCEHFNAMAQIEFGRCLSSGALNCYKSDHDCFAGVDEGIAQCEAEYRLCYENCGGTVTNSCDKS